MKSYVRDTKSNSTYLSMAVISKQNLFSIESDVRRMQDASVKVSLLLYRKNIENYSKNNCAAYYYTY